MSEIVTAHPTQPGSMLALIVEAAKSRDVDVAKLKELMLMQERLEERQAERNFNGALARVTFGMPRVKKNGTIDLGVDKQTGKARGALPFARWEDVDAIIRPRLEAEGFTLSFNSAPRAGDGGGAVISGTLLHCDGHQRTVSIPLPLDTGPGRNNLQAMGSTLSYGKRYCTEMLLNIVREGVDDDGATHGQKFITEEQAMQIETMLTETKSDRTAFMRLFKCEHNLLDMPAEVFVAAINALNMKKKKLEKAP
jgi:hypothetical protein